MIDTQKPPMVVWLQSHAPRTLARGESPKCITTRIDKTWDCGPYVHLDQFVEAVEKRVDRTGFPNTITYIDYDDEETWAALQELVKELKEGN